LHATYRQRWENCAQLFGSAIVAEIRLFPTPHANQFHLDCYDARSTSEMGHQRR
jgi:hypothetical protein